MNAVANAFVEDILANPQDDTPRLIYADWLEDHGDSERAEFIRVQIELERTPRHPAPVTRGQTETCPCPWCRLKCRARELRNAGYPSAAWVWAGSPLNAIYDAEYTFERGFVSAVKCSQKGWLRYGPTLVRQHPVEKVELSDKRHLGSEQDSPTNSRAWAREGWLAYPASASFVLDDRLMDLIAGPAPFNPHNPSKRLRREVVWYGATGNPDADLSKACLFYARQTPAADAADAPHPDVPGAGG